MPTPKTPCHRTKVETDQATYEVFMWMGGSVETGLPVVIAVCHDPNRVRADLRFDVAPDRTEEQLGELSAEEIFERCLTQMRTRRLIQKAFALAGKSYAGLIE